MLTTKVMNLPCAVRRFIQPGISLHFSFTHNRPMAFAYEIVRQFQDQKLELELVGTGFLEYAAVLVAGGHVRKLTGAFVGQTYPRPRPYKLIQQLLALGYLEVEWWTNLTMCQRFMAAAMHVPMIPTQSLKGSTLLLDLEKKGRVALFKQERQEDVVLIESCIPDVAVVHAAMSDADGNAVVPPPYGEELWGVRAARQVIVITERIVPSDTIRRMSHLVKIPGHLVDAVVEVPYGAHPYGVSPIGLEEGGYYEDYEFRVDLNRSLDKGVNIMEWMRRWGLDESQETFVKIHQERLRKLSISSFNRKKPEVGLHQSAPSSEEAVSAREMTAVVSSRIIEKKVIEENIQTILAGIGLSHLTAWMAQRRLERRGYDVKLLTETGYYGYQPAEGDPYIFNFKNLFSNLKQSSFVEILGEMVPHPTRRCLAVLSAAQIDRRGNLNSTIIPDRNLYLVGSGGANDIACTAFEVMVVVDGDTGKFIPELPYVTAPGQRVRTVMTSYGVFERRQSSEAFQLSGLMPNLNSAGAECLSTIQSVMEGKSGNWTDLPVFSPPTEDELRLLRSFDPHKSFLR